jgi:hypothetical protein
MTDPRVAALVCALLAAILYPVIVGSLLRMTHARHALAIFGVVALLILVAATAGGRSISLWHFAAYFSAGVAMVVFLYGAVLRSLSLEMLAELNCAGGAELPIDELTEKVVRPGYMNRALSLVNLGAATRRGDQYVVTARGRVAANRVEALRRRIWLTSLGLYGS